VKRTAADDLYAERFGEALQEAYIAAKRKGISDEVFAASIGVERPQLKKYLLGGAMPSVRTVALAQKEYGVRIPYQGVMLEQASRPPRREQTREAATQLRLPFSVHLQTPGDLQVDLKPIRLRTYEIRIKVRRSNSRKSGS
jgi:transcriptional regulator with XRE-family HTH domain